MPATTCRRCQGPLTPIYPGQTEHPLCCPTDTGWIPSARDHDSRHARTLGLALDLAVRGWHILPLSPASKCPLSNCTACSENRGQPAHRIADCPCIPTGAWCHGVRAATTNPEHIATWWTRQPDAIPAVAAGPSGLTLIDIDSHGEALPGDLATGLLPGIDLTTERLPERLWRRREMFHDGRDTLQLLARLRGGDRPWPTDSRCQPLTVVTPSGGRHLWYRAPAPDLHQQLSHPRGIAWQVDIKAGWSYGIAPGATSRKGVYTITSRGIETPGQMPEWLAREVVRVASPRPPVPAARPQPQPHAGGGTRPAAYLTAVIDRGAADLAAMRDGRQRALSALAFKTGGLLTWSGLDEPTVTEQLVDAGTAAGLPDRIARRTVHRALTNGINQPLPEPAHT